MAITRVQGASNTASVSATSISATFGATVGNGNAVIVYVWFSNGGTTTISDDKSNSYTLVDTNSVVSVRSFYLTNITNAPITVTVTFGTTQTGSNTVASIMIDEFSGIATSSPLDGHTINRVTFPGTGTDAVTSGSITTTTNGDLIWGAVIDELSITNAAAAGTGFTLGTQNAAGTNGRGATEYLIQGTAGSIAATFTQTASSGGRPSTDVIAFKAAPPAVAYVPPRRPGTVLVNRQIFY